MHLTSFPFKCLQIPFETSNLEQLLANSSRSIFLCSASASNHLKNVASIDLVLQIMRFDTVDTLVNGYGVPDFA